MHPDQPASAQRQESLWGLFLIFLRLGLTSFGGPVAHLGYFHNEFVTKRRFLSERSYADLVALCQFLPGPASSQVGIAIGLLRHGYPGAIASWAGFTLPSAIALILFALGIAHFGTLVPAEALHGLKVVAVAIVAQAVWAMARNLCTDAARISIMAVAACIALLLPNALGQLSVIAAAGLVGMLAFKPDAAHAHESLPLRVSRRTGACLLLLFAGLLIGLPILAASFPHGAIADISSFFRAGSLVFGGGHVVLPLLQSEVVPSGLVDNDTFLAGYGAAQAMPGPLFTFAAFLGASMNSSPSGWAGGLICLLAIFAPSFLLVGGAIPFWDGLRGNARMQAALAGINAGVVGLLLAALYQPVWTSAIRQPSDFAMAILALVALVFWKWPSWLVVLSLGAAGGAIGVMGQG
ncbi:MULTISPECIES: chromate efflux transporter [unclassified Herbaspirillum]|uniref:chromate efflux transporter n=1 Tax=unclassified Herbaspirillum TaxID=2624150 RepID=UPI00115188C9|nr:MULTISPECIES: chromate efflux transporter [unclassified Herbaspirillum]TQK05942.1 chromate transporter [Herbaspirillum sp. SJZ130]TQK12580.1 chromate transporter [Herbaspirillum sp. SJZ106]